MLFLVFAACTNKAVGTKTKAAAAKTVPTATKTAATTYQVDSGTLNWTGSKALGSSHQGTINISKGTLGITENRQITTGNFTIDMTSITNTDLPSGQGKEKLEGHLKSGDFFDIAQFPTGSFDIVKIESVTGVSGVSHNVTGNLTLKGVKKSITVPANITVSGGKISAVTPSFTIDRTAWGIQYGSCLLYTSPSPRDRG